MKKLAIVGFGAAGYHAAKEARRLDADCQIHVYSDSDLAPYNPMLTTYYVQDSIPYEALFPFGQMETICAQLRLIPHLGQAVLGIEPDQRRLHLASGMSEPYDGILISTGAAASAPPVPGADLPGVYRMRTVDDACALKQKLESGSVRRGLVIGASWVGIKIVENLLRRGIDCTLVEGAATVFAGAAFPETGARIVRDLEARGVAVHCGQMLQGIEANGQTLQARMQGGECFAADLIALCTGTRPQTAFLQESGIALGRGILVDDTLCSNYPGIYAAGDCCATYERQSGEQRNIGLWQNACEQGRIAGANLLGAQQRYGGSIFVNLGHYLDYDFACIGDPSRCQEGDRLYEYEDAHYYLRAVRDDRALKCLNMIGTAQSNGILKNLFSKSLASPGAPLDITTYCLLREQGFPQDFINFLGGNCFA